MDVRTELVIEPERPDDADAVRDVVGRAFHDEPKVADLVDLIRASPEYVPALALVARTGSARVAGVVLVSHALVVGEDDTRHDVLTLSPLAVAPEHQGRGIGAALVRAALAAAEAAGAGLVTLEGSPSYYGRLGFRPASDLGITMHLPDWAPRDAAQVCPLAGYDAAVRGVLRYPPAFAIVT